MDDSVTPTHIISHYTRLVRWIIVSVVVNRQFPADYFHRGGTLLRNVMVHRGRILEVDG